jgi:hypothetical protein
VSLNPWEQHDEKKEEINNKDRKKGKRTREKQRNNKERRV